MSCLVLRFDQLKAIVYEPRIFLGIWGDRDFFSLDIGIKCLFYVETWIIKFTSFLMLLYINKFLLRLTLTSYGILFDCE